MDSDQYRVQQSGITFGVHEIVDELGLPASTVRKQFISLYRDGKLAKRVRGRHCGSLVRRRAKGERLTDIFRMEEPKH